MAGFQPVEHAWPQIVQAEPKETAVAPSAIAFKMSPGIRIPPDMTKSTSYRYHFLQEAERLCKVQTTLANQSHR
jgi:hypothetical protein